MNIVITVSIGLSNCKRTHEVEFDDDEWRGMTPEQQEGAMSEAILSSGIIDWSYEEK